MAVIALAAGEARAGRGGERQVAPDGEVVAHVVVDVADGSAASDRERQWPGCRICHLADGDGELPQQLSGRLVRLGPGCRGELAAAHRRCAEAWFSVRGNRLQALRDLWRERGEHHRRRGQGVHTAVAQHGGGHGRQRPVQGVRWLLQEPVVLQPASPVARHRVPPVVLP
ncbi:hypothetical protein PAHAL_3G081300 [Panicum hallii]|uniref:RING-CH-type domain-containing protein n=1 Tax=Panicum hallii TaxID=206008 RepID=A0A2S3H715_9POAL|nr:hypothetical protein PAHAL_3G081300 [Panicum hallii]